MPDDGFQVISSSFCESRRVRDNTRSPRAVSAVLSAEPIRPEAPDIRTVILIVDVGLEMIKHRINNDAGQRHKQPAWPNPFGQASVPIKLAIECTINE